VEATPVIAQSFFEIERAHVAFAIFELESAQIGSGRPGGPRSALWGSIVVLARASLEEALRRVHRQICRVGDCEYTKVPLDPANFEKFFTEHDVSLAESIPVELHVALRSKSWAKGGDGTGAPSNGPLTRAELFSLLAALNHIRNGFAHRDPRKTEELPPSSEGLLWVAPESGTEWTVQKPHAFSALRFCHVVFRYVLLSCWGLDRALERRSALPVLLEDRLASRHSEDLVLLHDELGKSLHRNDPRAALSLTRTMKESLLSRHIQGVDLLQAALPLDDDEATALLSDAVLSPSPSTRSTERLTPESTLLDWAAEREDEDD